MRRLTASVTIAFALTSSVAGASAGAAPASVRAACLPPPPLCQAAARADLVFFGEVLETTTYPERTEAGVLPQGIQEVRFNVIRPFKGVGPGESWGFYYFGLDRSVEANGFRSGARYLVFAHRRATGAFMTGCTLTREMARTDEEEWLRVGAVELSSCPKAQP